MNANTNNRTNNTANNNKINGRERRACLLPFIPRKIAVDMVIGDVVQCFGEMMSQIKEFEVIHDFSKERSLIKAVYRDKVPNLLDADKIIWKMHHLNYGMLIIPSFYTFADKSEVCGQLLIDLHKANIRLISPFDGFDSEEIDKQMEAESIVLFKRFREVLRQEVAKCLVRNVDEFIDYVDNESTFHKPTDFVLACGNKAVRIPYSEAIREEIFDFLALLDEEYLRPELFTEDEFDDEDSEDDDEDIPGSEYGEPLVERDFEG